MRYLLVLKPKKEIFDLTAGRAIEDLEARNFYEKYRSVTSLTMRHLSTSLAPLRALTNLESLEVSFDAIPNGLVEVLQQNPKCQKLSVTFEFVDGTSGRSLQNWIILSQLKQVKCLNLKWCGPFPETPKRLPKFLYLEELIYEIPEEKTFFSGILLERMGPQLKRLTVHRDIGILNDSFLPFGHIRHLRDLEEIQLLMKCVPVDLLIPALKPLVKLRKLAFSTRTCEEEIVSILKGVPQLMEFETESLDEQVEKKISEYLREAGRTLKLNESRQMIYLVNGTTY